MTEAADVYVTIVQGLVVQGKIVQDESEVEGLSELVAYTKKESKDVTILSEVVIRGLDGNSVIHISVAVIDDNKLHGWFRKRRAMAR